MLALMNRPADAMSALLTCCRWLDNARCGTMICPPARRR
jgi:hypothetical protein